jgi:signal transduction histidine kinase
VSNLIVDALDALPEDGTLYLIVSKSKCEVHGAVADNGHGTPQAAADKMFEPFFTTTKEHGTGLGRAITRSIAERHRRRIRLQSSVRRNSSGGFGSGRCFSSYTFWNRQSEQLRVLIAEKLGLPVWQAFWDRAS